MDVKELKEILEQHKKWQIGEGGERADLRDADLRDADLRDADLRYADLRYADLRYANLRDADLRDADLRYADLRDADLRDADLRDADLRYADLRDADLRSADLRYVNLRYADLRDANLGNVENLEKVYQSNLAILKYQKGKLIAFKYLDGNTSPYQTQIYEVGKVYETDDFERDERVLCGKGLNIATLDWCLQDASFDLEKTYIEVEFDAEDIVAIPYNTDGIFRVRKLKVIRKIPKKELKECLKSVSPAKEKK